jgi:hypothetical protein
MATTTTNFGWDIPQSTDLVKDGATAIAALGQDIDTAFVDFKGGTTGQVLKKTSGTDLDVEWGTASSGLTLINTTSFSGVSSQSVSDVFSTTYDNYKIIVAANSSTAANSLRVRMRVSGADNSTSNYFFAGFQLNSNASTGVAFSGETQTSGQLVILDANVRMLATMDVLNPFLTEKTVFTGFGQRVGNHNMNMSFVEVELTTSFTGFTLFPASGTMTGTVSVYGYSK